MNKKFTERSEKMRTFDKSTKLDNVLYDVRGPVVDEAARMEEEGKETRIRSDSQLLRK